MVVLECKSKVQPWLLYTRTDQLGQPFYISKPQFLHLQNLEQVPSPALRLLQGWELEPAGAMQKVTLNTPQRLLPVFKVGPKCHLPTHQK